jgi:hypothetical protein
LLASWQRDRLAWKKACILAGMYQGGWQQNSRLRGRHQGRIVSKELGWHRSRHKEQVSADARSRQNSRLRGRLAGKKEAKHAQRQAFCLEAVIKKGINNVQQILY